MRAVRPILGTAALLFAAACASDTTPTAPVTTAAPGAVALDRERSDFGSDQASDHRHVFELRNSPGVGFARLRSGGGTGISYHGGPVLLNGTKLVAVYWSGSPIYAGGPAAGTKGSGTSDRSLIGNFLRTLGGSPYFNINTTYTNGGTSHIANVVNYTGFWANGASAPTGTQSVTDAQMIAMLQSGLNSGALAYDPSTLYLIFTSGQVNLGGGFGGSHFQYCAYHTHGTVTVGGVNKTILYAAMPYDYAYPASCSNGTASPNNDAAADAEISVMAHEIEETTTDMMGNAWYDTRGYENADKCAWNFGTTHSNGTGIYNITVAAKNYLVQQNWVNSGSGGCVQQWP